MKREHGGGKKERKEEREKEIDVHIYRGPVFLTCLFSWLLFLCIFLSQRTAYLSTVPLPNPPFPPSKQSITINNNEKPLSRETRSNKSSGTPPSPSPFLTTHTKTQVVQGAKGSKKLRKLLPPPQKENGKLLLLRMCDLQRDHFRQHLSLVLP